MLLVATTLLGRSKRFTKTIGDKFIFIDYIAYMLELDLLKYHRELLLSKNEFTFTYWTKGGT